MWPWLEANGPTALSGLVCILGHFVHKQLLCYRSHSLVLWVGSSRARSRHCSASIPAASTGVGLPHSGLWCVRSAGWDGSTVCRTDLSTDAGSASVRIWLCLANLEYGEHDLTLLYTHIL